jgi:hypothetical protein
MDRDRIQPLGVIYRYSRDAPYSLRALGFSGLGFSHLLARRLPPSVKLRRTAVALAEAGRASLGPQALGFSHLLAGPHPRSRSLGDFAPRSGRRRFPLSLSYV